MRGGGMWLAVIGAIGCSWAADPQPPAFDHDHAALGAVLSGVVRPEGVDYAAHAERRPALDAYLATLATAPVGSFGPGEQLSLWVNAYNAYTLALVLDNPTIGSLKDLDQGEVWKRRTFRVAGEDLTLDQIEHERARKLADGRVHAVLSCAARGCPPLPGEPLRAGTIDAQLGAAARTWVSTNAFAIRGDTIHLSEIFKWFPEDFADYRKQPVPAANEAQTRALWFIAAFTDEELGRRLTAGVYAVAWEPYDWALNRLDVSLIDDVPSGSPGSPARPSIDAGSP